MPSRRQLSTWIEVSVFILAVAGGLASFLGWKSAYATLRLLLMAAVIMAYLGVRRKYRWRLKMREEAGRRSREAASNLAADEPSDFVLYLRPFSADPVVTEKISKPGWRIGNIWQLFEDPDRSINEVVYLSLRSISPELAPLTLSGNRPSGMVETHEVADDWKTTVLSLAEKAKLIIILLSSTEGLVFELRQLIATGLIQKTIVLIPPRSDGRQRWHRIRGVLEEEFEYTYELLREVGLTPPAPDSEGLVVFWGKDSQPVYEQWAWDGHALGSVIRLALKSLQ